MQDQLAAQFGRTCAIRLDLGKVQAGAVAKEQEKADVEAMRQQMNPNARKKRVDPNAKRTLPR